MELKVFQTIEELNNFAAEKFVEIGNRAIEKHDRFSIALAGGSTPKSLYRLLSTEKFKNIIDRSKVFFFFGDERNVLPGDEESNFRMANENLFQPLKISESNVFRWQTELEKEKVVAADYENKIKMFFNLAENEFPKFDLILLGMGDDGHTASLFPFTDAVRTASGSDRHDSFSGEIVTENFVEKLNDCRFTFTFPTINNAENIIFLVKGEDKAETLKNVLEGEFNPQKLPSQNVKPDGGNLFWLVDSSAAKYLSSKNK